jgi:hypothetical protein
MLGSDSEVSGRCDAQRGLRRHGVQRISARPSSGYEASDDYFCSPKQYVSGNTGGQSIPPNHCKIERRFTLSRRTKD